MNWPRTFGDPGAKLRVQFSSNNELVSKKTTEEVVVSNGTTSSLLSVGRDSPSLNHYPSCPSTLCQVVVGAIDSLLLPEFLSWKRPVYLTCFLGKAPPR